MIWISILINVALFVLKWFMDRQKRGLAFSEKQIEKLRKVLSVFQVLEAKCATKGIVADAFDMQAILEEAERAERPHIPMFSKEDEEKADAE